MIREKKFPSALRAVREGSLFLAFSALSLLPLLRLRKMDRRPPTRNNSHKKAPPLQTERGRTIRLRDRRPG